MGLSIGEAHWSYGGFMHFRERLAGEIGVPLRLMEGFWRWPDSIAQVTLGVGADPIPQLLKSLPIKWIALRPDKIHGLLSHSDCDGDLTPAQCRSIAPRLEELVRPWNSNDYDKIQAMALVKEMRRASQQKRKLRFT